MKPVTPSSSPAMAGQDIALELCINAVARVPRPKAAMG